MVDGHSSTSGGIIKEKLDYNDYRHALKPLTTVMHLIPKMQGHWTNGDVHHIDYASSEDAFVMQEEDKYPKF